MSRMWHLRAALLTVIGALSLHQARYFLVPPEHAHTGMHTYFAWAVPLVAVLAIAGMVELGVRLARTRGEAAPPLPPTGLLFAVFAFTLLTIFGAQETLEMVFAHGYIPAENPWIVDGAWISIPLAIAIGGLLTLLLRGVALVIARATARPPLRRPRRDLGRAPGRLAYPAHSGISRSLAPRGPPALS